ncbi:MAG: cobyric acid synthase [Firmicutes bacterium]|nr:cobyric acid synthase [Bacillota bacterium]
MAGIMIQGTASSAGKSLMTTALCRIFANDGWCVYPFKSQNMSLNSYVTMEGLEMGRAQVLQAQAARVEPSALMNPILLKPTSDRKSQVIVNGKPYQNMDAVEYFQFKARLKEMIRETYRRLEEKCDVVVIEGAGSPAEINLKSADIVNMGMAEMADAPVLLVADIDKGGVFASIYGTVMLLEPQERDRIKGVIINKFRGDKSILQSGIDMLEDLIKIPVVGVIPYMNVHLDEEDGATEFNRKTQGDIDICVIKLPRISNFTDFDAFKFDDDVAVRYITSLEEIGNADMIVIPGSKNTIEDLRWLKRTGLDKGIKDFEGIVFGICGGYQMLGRKMIDVEGWEVSKGEWETGLALFDTVTELKGDKVTANIEGEVLGRKVYGYEIHCGKTYGNLNPLVKVTLKENRETAYKDGEMKAGRYFGTYIHGIFDSNAFREYILNKIRKQKSLAERSSVDLRIKREEELEKLAATVRDNMDMAFVYGLVRGSEFGSGR